MARSRRRNRDIRVAKARARVRFGPEASTLTALAGQAKTAYRSDLTSADAAAKSAIHFANKARKPVAAVFKQARTEADAARSDVQTAFGKIGGGADPFRAATAREQAGAHARVALAGANALHELTQRKLEAKAGGQYARTAAKQDYRTTLGTIRAKRSDLRDRKGAFIIGEAGALKEARAKRNVPIQVAKIKAKGDAAKAKADYKRDVAKATTKFERDQALIKYRNSLSGGGGGGGGVGGGKPASRSELRMFKSDFAQALEEAKEARAHGVGRGEAHGKLTTGTTGKNAIPRIDDQLALQSALDMAYGGHVSRANARTLHIAGLRVKDVPGALSYSQYQRRRPRRGSSGGGVRSGPLGY